MLDELSAEIGKPKEMTFKGMLDLMHVCDIIDKLNIKDKESTDKNEGFFESILKPFEGAIEEIKKPFEGIVPGTKWCGNGDVAHTYSDLGKRILVFFC